ncbi:hypothetical protein OG921_13020 [Aldersonia sp. NBC_00410]|uniref:hypothetical protein n=1 Tax=Aldersonia sp. NBC_00410 TaxID=2975954 RepID=UPI002252B996|nr:hypothetical protein [Aldersonia sp. NBC_00410]MCX5044087.1 hypothetical protein [Aldersonia sp. NBC_00410]
MYIEQRWCHRTCAVVQDAEDTDEEVQADEYTDEECGEFLEVLADYVDSLGNTDRVEFVDRYLQDPIQRIRNSRDNADFAVTMWDIGSRSANPCEDAR